jgi:predicted PurR-regulated permease PerM
MFWRNLFVFIGIPVIILLFVWVASKAIDISLIVIISVFLSVALNPLVTYFESVGLNRTVATLVVFASLLVLLGILIFFPFPCFYESI